MNSEDGTSLPDRQAPSQVRNEQNYIEEGHVMIFK